MPGRFFFTLAPFRNEVVHSNSFSVSGDTLTLSSSRSGASLTLSGKQMDCLVRFARILARSLIGEISVDAYKLRVIHSYLDALAPLHGLDDLQSTDASIRPRGTRRHLRKGLLFRRTLKQVRDVAIPYISMIRKSSSTSK